LQSPLYPRYSTHARGTSWLGSLVANKHDGSGLVYMRNRYLNPQTGQFTQTDPIGLAGGLNLYGYANGDPVNFHDPFGLCGESVGGDEDKVQTRYAHLSRSCVGAGEHVEQGQLIGYTGGDPVDQPNAGTSTGPHLHFEVRRIRPGATNTAANAASEPLDPTTTLSTFGGIEPVDGFSRLSSPFGG
jgi:RHS repeat-associated protein